MQPKFRILETALRLFNERGAGSVTNAELAAGAGMRVGNLWYHFRTKEDIIAALRAMLEQRLQETVLSARSESADGAFLPAYIEYFQLIWEFRFLYRDGAGCVTKP